MIGKITGRLDYRGDDHILVDVHGVGYVVHVSERTLAALPGVGEAVSLFTELLVREDLLQLFGFTSRIEREWHRLLTSVQGIGAKGAMAILGTLGADALGRAIAVGDWHAVKAAPGVGPKTAQRVVNELKDKVPAVMAMGELSPAESVVTNVDDAIIESPAVTVATQPAPATRGTAQADALSALRNLGYQPGEAAAAVARAAGEAPDADTPALIRAALRRLAPGDGR